jgi:hypothetical protein
MLHSIIDLTLEKRTTEAQKLNLSILKKNFPKAIYKLLVSSKQAGTLIYDNNIYIISGVKNPPLQTV